MPFWPRASVLSKFSSISLKSSRYLTLSSYFSLDHPISTEPKVSAQMPCVICMQAPTDEKEILLCRRGGRAKKPRAGIRPEGGERENKISALRSQLPIWGRIICGGCGAYYWHLGQGEESATRLISTWVLRGATACLWSPDMHKGFTILFIDVTDLLPLSN